MADLPQDSHTENNTNEGSATVSLDIVKATVEQLKDKKLLIRERALHALTDYLLHVTDEQTKSTPQCNNNNFFGRSYLQAIHFPNFTKVQLENI